MLQHSVTLLIIALMLAAPAPTHAADAVAKCQGMKIKATGKKTYDKAKCYQKAVVTGEAVDPECLTKAETKFTAAIAKADATGTCAGDAATLEAAVDDCVTEYRGIVQPPITTTTSTTTSTSPGADCGNGVLDGTEQCDDNDLMAGDGCDGACAIEGGYSCTGEPSVCTTAALRFSEYVEVSTGTDKALEIINPGGSVVPLAGCSVRIYANGSASVTSEAALANTLDAGDVLVVCNNVPSVSLAPLCDQVYGITFNGDDAIEVQCNGTPLDIIGQIGTDPGFEWGTSPTSTADHTLRRKCSVSAGDQNGGDAFDPAVEWSSVGVDDYTGLGDPACAP
jgi:cysteine-rich repeat protein